MSQGGAAVAISFLNRDFDLHPTFSSLDSAAQTVRLAREGMQLDAGAIGKGYAADAAAESAKP